MANSRRSCESWSIKSRPAARRCRPRLERSPCLWLNRGASSRGYLRLGYPKTRLSSMALTDALRAQLERVLTEQRERERLRQHGFAPMRKLLLVGPPGTGRR